MDQKLILIVGALGIGGYYLYSQMQASTTTVPTTDTGTTDQSVTDTSIIDPSTGEPYTSGEIDPSTGYPYTTNAIDPQYMQYPPTYNHMQMAHKKRGRRRRNRHPYWEGNQYGYQPPYQQYYSTPTPLQSPTGNWGTSDPTGGWGNYGGSDV